MCGCVQRHVNAMLMLLLLDVYVRRCVLLYVCQFTKQVYDCFISHTKMKSGMCNFWLGMSITGHAYHETHTANPTMLMV